MSFIGAIKKGHSIAPGWFLESEVGVVRKTRQIKQEGATDTENGGKYVPMGTVWPANDATAEGIVYEDRLPATISTKAKTVLEGKGFTFIATSPSVTRPY